VTTVQCMLHEKVYVKLNPSVKRNQLLSIQLMSWINSAWSVTS
jgi:hypothetical protein